MQSDLFLGPPQSGKTEQLLDKITKIVTTTTSANSIVCLFPTYNYASRFELAAESRIKKPITVKFVDQFARELVMSQLSKRAIQPFEFKSRENILQEVEKILKIPSNLDRRRVLNYLLDLHNNGESPETIALLEHPDAYAIATMYDELISYLKKRRLFENMELNYCVLAIETMMAVPHSVSRYKYAILDDFQFFSKLQLEMIKTLCYKTNCSLISAGDENLQFSSTSINNSLHSFVNNFTPIIQNINVKLLPTSKCSQDILEIAANSFKMGKFDQDQYVQSNQLAESTVNSFTVNNRIDFVNRIFQYYRKNPDLSKLLIITSCEESEDFLNSLSKFPQIEDDGFLFIKEHLETKIGEEAHRVYLFDKVYLAAFLSYYRAVITDIAPKAYWSLVLYGIGNIPQNLIDYLFFRVNPEHIQLELRYVCENKLSGHREVSKLFDFIEKGKRMHLVCKPFSEIFRFYCEEIQLMEKIFRSPNTFAELDQFLFTESYLSSFDDFQPNVILSKISAFRTGGYLFSIPKCFTSIQIVGMNKLEKRIITPANDVIFFNFEFPKAHNETTLGNDIFSEIDQLLAPPQYQQILSQRRILSSLITRSRRSINFVNYENLETSEKLNNHNLGILDFAVSLPISSNNPREISLLNRISLSYSSLRVYHQCQFKFYLTYVKREAKKSNNTDTPNNFAIDDDTLNTPLSELFIYDFTTKNSKKLSISKFAIIDKRKGDVPTLKINADDYQTSNNYSLVRNLATSPMKQKNRPSLSSVEQTISVQVDGATLFGSVDQIEYSDQGLPIIREFKSSLKGVKSAIEQVGFYLYLYEKSTNIRPDHGIVEVHSDSPSHIIVDPSDVNNEFFRRLIAQTIHQIRANSFKANPTHKNCSNCDHALVCPLSTVNP